MSQAFQVSVEGVDVVAVSDTKEGRIVEVCGVGVVLEDVVVEHVIDAKLQLKLLEERQDLVYGQSVLDVLLFCQGSPGRSPL